MLCAGRGVGGAPHHIGFQPDIARAGDGGARIDGDIDIAGGEQRRTNLDGATGEACLGAAIGMATLDGTLRFLERIDSCPKLEGVAARVDDNVIRLLLVTDADDPAIPASLYATTTPNLAL